MLFHVEVLSRENVGIAEGPTQRENIAKQLNVIMKSGKVKDSGAYAGERGGFFVIDIDSPEELWRFFAPVLDGIKVNAYPIVPMDQIPKLFEELEK